MRIGARSNLPRARTVVIGRQDSMEAVSRELSRRRIVTIAGPGGIGKTTLAIATAEALRGSFGDAVLFVDLAPIEDPALVVSTLLSALGLVVGSDDPVAAIIEYLRDKRLLIVLDNCEQVVEAVAGLADRILQETVDIHLLVTSREPLRIAGERVHRLAPLECPPIQGDITAVEAKAYAAVQLFVDRATKAPAVSRSMTPRLPLSPRSAGVLMEFRSQLSSRRRAWNSSGSPLWRADWTTCLPC